MKKSKDCNDMPKDVKKKMAKDMKKKNMKDEKMPMSEQFVNWLNVFVESTDIVEIEARKDVSPADKKRAQKEYGKTTNYADEKNKKYPLDAEHIHAAIAYWGMPKNRAKYSPEDQKKISSKIAKAAKKFGVEMKENFEETTANPESKVIIKRLRGVTEGVVFADSKSNKFPIGTADEIKMAATDFSKNYEQYTNDEMKAIAKKIAAAAKRNDVELSKVWMDKFNTEGTPVGNDSLPKQKTKVV